MDAERKEELASKISEEIIAKFWDHPNINGFHGLGWRGTTGIENEIYGFLIEHATFTENENGK